MKNLNATERKNYLKKLVELNERYNNGLKQIPSYPRYSVNKEGTIVKDNATGKEKNFYLNRGKKSNSYFIVNIKDLQGNSKMKYVHHLVAEAFISERPEGLVLNHIDGNEKNNDVNNLEYITQNQNIKLSTKKRKEVTKLSFNDIIKMRVLYGSQAVNKIGKIIYNLQVLCEMFDVAYITAYRICKYKTNISKDILESELKYIQAKEMLEKILETE